MPVWVIGLVKIKGQGMDNRTTPVELWENPWRKPSSAGNQKSSWEYKIPQSILSNGVQVNVV